MFQRPRMLTVTAALAGAAIIGAGGGAATYAAFSSGNSKTVVRQVTVAGSDAAATNASLSVSQIYNRTNKGVVEITVTSAGQTTPFGGSQSQQAQGSGFVYDDSGHIVTNQHVVDGANSISVKFWNGASYKATLVGSDASTDLAVIQVDAPSSLLHPLSLGDSSKIAVGDGVVAIGSPFGLEETVTSGIVSALHRSMTAPNDFTINDSIQTDAAINHGNSGGPLLNANGEVIGVNSQIQTGGTSNGNVGVGFAIPIDTVRTVAAQLIHNGKVVHASLGITGQAVDANVASVFHFPVDHGVLVQSVKDGSGAAKAGLRAGTNSVVVAGESWLIGGDLIVRADGQRIESLERLRDVIAGKKPGDTLELEVYRGTKKMTIDIELGRQPTSPQ
jgi:S1-C subfamily serine protease